MEAIRTFDRKAKFDLRSLEYPVTAVIDTPEYVSNLWGCETWNDQGQEGACVGFGWSHELSAEPFPVPTNHDIAMQIYNMGKTLDGIPGEDYSGTTLLGGAKAVSVLTNATGERYIEEYRWAFGLDDLIRAVGHVGPAVLGLNWYTGMYGTDADGFIRKTGRLSGGHCLTAIGVHAVPRSATRPAGPYNINRSRSYFTLRNSWGRGWGTDGNAKISFIDMDALLKLKGEACIPITRRV